jgi:hypothetical protein
MKRFFAVISLFVLFAFAHPASAAADACAGNTTSIICAIGAQVPCMKTGSCGSLDDILQVFAVVSQWLLGIAGSVMLLMFVWGGAEFVYSRGDSKLVGSGKSKMSNALIGIVIMFGALAMVRSVRVGLLGADNPIVQCVVDNDCNNGQACFAGECMSKTDPRIQASKKAVGQCTSNADCTAVGFICAVNPNASNQDPTNKTCQTLCMSKNGACATACPIGKENLMPGTTNTGSLLCSTGFPETAVCCKQ